MFYSPLRYPGGKNKLSAFIAKICIDNGINGHYVEPYTGGGSVALFLLCEGYVQSITINDKDRSIYAFWYSVLNESEALCDLIENTDITIENWSKQKEIQRNKQTANLLELGFSTLFLNRTNRSGIIKGGVMGGLKQEGNYKMDCRYNREEIISRIKLIYTYRRCIKLYNDDAVDLIDRIEAEADNINTVFYFDPPYYLKADQLYMNHYMGEHHKSVSDKIKAIKNIHWVVSYDDNINIENLYRNLPVKKYSFNHSAGTSKAGKEILFFSEGLSQPEIENYNPVNFKIRKNKTRKEIIYKEKK